jgi:hypothetical protein
MMLRIFTPTLVVPLVTLALLRFLGYIFPGLVDTTLFDALLRVIQPIFWG